MMRAQSRRTDTLIRVFSELRIPLCFAGQFVISRWIRSRAWRTSRNVGGDRGRRRTSQDVERTAALPEGWGRFDGKSRLRRGEARRERKGERGGAEWRRVCRSSIGRFSPRSAVSPVHQQLTRAHRRLRPPLERADGLG